MATRYLREHPRAAAAVSAQYRPLDLQSGRTRCHRRQPQQPTSRYPCISFAIRGLRTYARNRFDNLSFLSLTRCCISALKPPTQIVYRDDVHGLRRGNHATGSASTHEAMIIASAFEGGDPLTYGLYT